jgi:hypothetical protein
MRPFEFRGLVLLIGCETIGKRQERERTGRTLGPTSVTGLRGPVGSLSLLLSWLSACIGVIGG